MDLNKESDISRTNSDKSERSQNNNFTPDEELKLENDINQMRLEKSFDPRFLSAQQTNYLAQLQSIYNDLNNTNLNLFTAPPEAIQKLPDVSSSFKTQVIKKPPYPTILPLNQTQIKYDKKIYNNMLEYDGDVINEIEPQRQEIVSYELNQQNFNPKKDIQETQFDTALNKVIGNNTPYYQIIDTSPSSSDISTNANRKHDNTYSHIDDGKADLTIRPIVNLPTLEPFSALNDYTNADAFKINFRPKKDINELYDSSFEATYTTINYVDNDNINTNNTYKNGNNVEKSSDLETSGSKINIPINRVINLASTRRPRVAQTTTREKPSPPKLFKRNDGYAF